MIVRGIRRILPSQRRRRRNARASRRRFTDAELAAQWEAALSESQLWPYALAQVTEVKHSYRYRGTKAWLTWYDTNEKQDAWFERAWPAQGSWVVVSGNTSYGPHSNNPRTFYVHHLKRIVPADAPHGWTRHQQLVSDQVFGE